MAPVEPPPSAWALPDPLDADADGVCGVGADLAPGTLLAAYRRGLFPMPGEGIEGVLWWSPVERGVLPLDGLRTTRSMRQSVRRMEIRVDTAFAAVVAGCADPRQALDSAQGHRGVGRVRPGGGQRAARRVSRTRVQ